MKLTTNFVYLSLGALCALMPVAQVAAGDDNGGAPHPGLPDLPDHLEAVRPTVMTTVVGEVSNPHQAARSPHLEAVRPTVVTTVAGEVSNPHQAARSPHRAASSPHQARQVPAVMTVARDQAALPHRARSPPKSSGVNVRRASPLLPVLVN